jgi:hypothetical protein
VFTAVNMNTSRSLFQNILLLIKLKLYFCHPNAKVAQLVEHDLAKVGVASSNLVFRSNPFGNTEGFFLFMLF